MKNSKVKVKEREAKKAILDYLAYQERLGKCYVLRTGSGSFQTKDGGWFKTGKKGAPDIVMCWSGKIASAGRFGMGTFVAIEVKGDKGMQSVEQVAAQKQIEKLGGKYILARSIKDVEVLF